MRFLALSEIATIRERKDSELVFDFRFYLVSLTLVRNSYSRSRQERPKFAYLTIKNSRIERFGLFSVGVRVSSRSRPFHDVK